METDGHLMSLHAYVDVSTVSGSARCSILHSKSLSSPDIHLLVAGGILLWSSWKGPNIQGKFGSFIREVIEPAGCPASRQPAAWLQWHYPLVSLNPMSPSPDRDLRGTGGETMAVSLMGTQTDDSSHGHAELGHVPGAQLSTRAPSALPVLQSWLKLVMGRSGTLCWIQPSRRCLGVFDSAWTQNAPTSSSSSTNNRCVSCSAVWYFYI